MMTNPNNVEKRANDYCVEFKKEASEVDGEMEAMIRTIIGRCCNCTSRFGCMVNFLATMGVTKEKLLEAAGMTFANCGETYTWHIKLNVPDNMQPIKVVKK